MRILRGKTAEAYVREIERRGSCLDALEPTVRRIVEDVRRNGDRSLLKYACTFDGVKSGQGLWVSDAEIRRAYRNASADLKSALGTAEKRIRQFCEWQKPREWSRSRDGITLGQVVRPLDSVGCYVPGGRFPLVSTLLMTVIPAQVAGVKNIRVVSPRPSSEVLAAAGMLGIKEFYRIGGAQAIAALAYGTQSVARVDKVVGPGSSYVTAAKKIVAFDCAIDMLAGPTEVVIVSSVGNPAFIAADLVAQAEHDPETLAVFITTSEKLAFAVSEGASLRGWGSFGSAQDRRPRPHINENASRSLTERGGVLIAGSKQEAFDWANRIASEHITIEKNDVDLVQNAGSIFVGDYSAQAAGDYASGPNHVLPTGGAARFRSGLTVTDFVKVITVQELSQRGLSQLAPAVVHLAETEGLCAHADSIRLRRASA